MEYNMLRTIIIILVCVAPVVTGFCVWALCALGKQADQRTYKEE
jgi:hypothetical protein